MTALEAYQKVIFESVKLAGSRAPKGLGEARIKFCKTRKGGKPCEYVGMVNPLPKVVTEGCTKCGCPFATKPFMLTLMGKQIQCPHPNGNLWADIDKKFNL